MRRFLVNRMLDYFGRRYNYDVSYMRAISDASPSAFGKFGKITALSRHREAVPIEISHAARLVGVLTEDCGPCTQLAADMAREAGVMDEQIRAIVSDDWQALPAQVLLACRFARAMIGQGPVLVDLREQVRQLWGDKGVIDLTFATQMSRIYPMVKAGLGYAATCRSVTVGTGEVTVSRMTIG
jgi:hypothetical protein